MKLVGFKLNSNVILNKLIIPDNCQKESSKSDERFCFANPYKFGDIQRHNEIEKQLVTNETDEKKKNHMSNAEYRNFLNVL